MSQNTNMKQRQREVSGLDHGPRHHRPISAVERLEQRRLLSGTIAPDQFEDNDTLATATNFETLDVFTQVNGLTIDAPNDDDFYRFTIGANGNLDVDLAFSDALGDVDVQLLDAAGNFIIGSAGTGDTESFSLAVTRGTTYVLRVFGFLGATNPDYDMTLDGPGVNGDGFEPNDTLSTASNLGAFTSNFLPDLTIHNLGNNDYFRFTAPGNGPASMAIDFRHLDGDIDMELYDTAGNVLGGSFGTGNTELINLNVVAGTDYVLGVFGFAGAITGDYDLSINLPADNQAPSVVSTAFEFQTRQRVSFTFSENVAPASIQLGDLFLFNDDTGDVLAVPPQTGFIYFNATRTLEFTFNELGGLAGTLPRGNYEAILPAGSVTDLAGNGLSPSAKVEFFVTPGDANRNRAVNLADFNILRSNFGQSGRTFGQGDFDYSGTVNLADFNILRSNFGTTLAPPSPDDLFGPGGGGEDDEDDLPTRG